MWFHTEEIKRELGQHFVCGFHGYEMSEDVKSLVRDYHVGSIILMKRNLKDTKQAKTLVRDLQMFAKDCGHQKPLMIGIDQENGLCSAFSSPTAGTQFPGAMAVAATGSTDQAHAVAVATARELKLVGINWTYSPVADVNSDSSNPVIGVRSFGDDPQEVGKYAAAVSRGLTSHGVAPSAKHFPGHGDTHVDSHLALPRIMKTEADIFATELVPFQSLIKDNVATIMTGHMALPLIVGDDTPCSLSRLITTDLLRCKLGYKGVIVTDCLEMDAIADTEQGGCGIEEGSVRALEAGADVVMICHTFGKQKGAMERVYQATSAGRLQLEHLRESGRRIMSLKRRFAGNWEDVLGEADQQFESEWEDLKRSNLKLSAAVYANSIALIQDQAGVLPLKSGREVILFTPEVQSVNAAVDDPEEVLRASSGHIRNTVGASFMSLAASVGQRAPCTHTVYYAKGSEVEGLRRASAIIFVMRNADRAQWQISHLRKVLEAKEKSGVPVVLLASCAPYDLLGVDGVDGAAYIASFEFTPAAFEAAAQVIFGEERARGTMPVKQGPTQ